MWRWEGPDRLISLHDPFLCVERDDAGGDTIIELRDFDSREVVRRFPRPEPTGPHGHWEGLWVQFAGVERAAIDTFTGETVWRAIEESSAVHKGPRIVGDIAYCGQVGVSAFGLRDGALRWRAESVREWLTFGPHIVGDRLFCATRDRKVHILDRHSGEVLTSFGVEEEPFVAQPMGHDRVIVGSLTRMACYELVAADVGRPVIVNTAAADGPRAESPPAPGSHSPIDVLVFGGFAAAALSRLLTSTLSARLAWQVAVLVLLALFGYRCATRGRLWRVSGILAFLAGWFWAPVPALALLVAVALFQRRVAPPKEKGTGPVTEPSEHRGGIQEGARGKDEGHAMGGELGRSMLTMKVAAESPGKIVAFHGPFSSPYGDGVIPLLMETEHGQRAYYVETGPWDAVTQEQCLRWLAALRTSDREDLDVEIRSDQEIPDLLRHYTARTPGVLFELVGLLHVRVFEQPDFGRENAATLKRLAAEYLEMHFEDGVPGLETLDRLVVDALRPGGQILPSTILLLGSFFGETLIAQNGGRWSVEGPGADQVAVELASKDATMTAYVFGKVMKLFHNGAEDSTAWMARSINERLG